MPNKTYADECLARYASHSQHSTDCEEADDYRRDVPELARRLKRATEYMRFNTRYMDLGISKKTHRVVDELEAMPERQEGQK